MLYLEDHNKDSESIKGVERNEETACLLACFKLTVPLDSMLFHWMSSYIIFTSVKKFISVFYVYYFNHVPYTHQ